MAVADRINGAWSHFDGPLAVFQDVGNQAWSTSYSPPSAPGSSMPPARVAGGGGGFGDFFSGLSNFASGALETGFGIWQSVTNQKTAQTQAKADLAAAQAQREALMMQQAGNGQVQQASMGPMLLIGGAAIVGVMLLSSKGKK